MTSTSARNPPTVVETESTSIYVGDLDTDVKEVDLYNCFSINNPGQVTSIHICRDRQTNYSLGYAYVNFASRYAAEQALDEWNFEQLPPLVDGSRRFEQPMRIMWSERNPSARQTARNNVFVKNLEKTIDSRALFDTFSSFGEILSCKVAESEAFNNNNQKQEEDNQSQSKHGFVHFKRSESADESIQRVNNMLINDQQVYVGRFIRRAHRLRSANVYVKNLAVPIDDDEEKEDKNDTVNGEDLDNRLRKVFEKYGEITAVSWATTDDNKSSKGFGFVNFKEVSSADKAIKALNGTASTELSGDGKKKLFVGRFQKKVERVSNLKRIQEERKQNRRKLNSRNLFIKHLDDTVDDERLRKEFAAFGTITSAKVMMENGRSKGFGFVCFSSYIEATNALASMNGLMVGSKPLYVALAQCKEDRKNHFSKKMADITQERCTNATCGSVTNFADKLHGARMADVTEESI